MIFITGTDTNIGKTVATFVLGVLMQRRGIDVGVMKPVQCSGNDARFLKESLKIKDSIEEINPFYAPEPLSPHLAFGRRGQVIDVKKTKKIYDGLSQKHEYMLVEGAGGVMVPLGNNYFVLDMIKELNLDVVIVAGLGLGTINHTILTINQVRSVGLNVRGVIFNEGLSEVRGIPEQTNPQAIEEFGDVKILGTIPYLDNFGNEHVVKVCSNKVNIQEIVDLFKVLG